jgi:hypothetical protein
MELLRLQGTMIKSPCWTVDNPEKLVSCGVGTGLAVLRKYPLGSDIPNRFEAACELRGYGVEGAMVYHEGF